MIGVIVDRVGHRPGRALGFIGGAPEQLDRLLGRLQAECPQAEWDLVCLSERAPQPPAGMHVLPSSPTLQFAVALWLRTLRQRYHGIYVAVPDSARREALTLMTEFVSVLPARGKFILDEAGGHRRIGLTSTLGAVLSLLLTAILFALSVLVTAVGLRFAHGGRPPVRREGGVAILVPILPDLSHTFVYREVLEVKARHPEYEVLVLEVGDAAVIHREAAELMKVAETVPRLSRNRYLAAHLGHWLRRPRAMADLIRFFQPYTETFGPGARSHDRWCFLRLQYLHHSNYPILGLMLAECLRGKGISYVHVHGSTYPAVRALVANRLLGVEFSLSTFVDFDYVTPFHMLSPKLETARFVVTCTEYCRQRLMHGFPAQAAKLRVLRHALGSDYERDKTLRPSDGRSRLIYIGRFVPKKGLDTLIEACAILRTRKVPVSCHLYGTGELANDLVQLVERHRLADMVRFEGVIPNEAIYTVMNHDDIFVTPSRYMDDGERDGIPVTLLEAMAAGITVVSTPVSGIPELVHHGVNGYLVRENDPGALADRLEWLVSDRQRRDTVSEAARTTIREEFSLERAGALLSEWISRESRS